MVNPYVVITIIIFIIVLILMFTWSYVVKQPKKFSTTTQFTTAGFGMQCVNDPSLVVSTDPLGYTLQRCGDEMTCVYFSPNDTFGYCRKSEGASCNNIYECEPSMKMCFEGICSKTSSGGLNQKSPCLDPLVDIDGICKLPEGAKCTASSECSIGQCVAQDPNVPSNRICKIPKENGEDCIYNQDCVSNYCDFSTGNGFCQPLGVQTGDLGAACFYYQANLQTTFCTNDFSCNLDLAIPNNNLGECLTEVYTWPSNNLNNECITNSCIPPSICYNGKCIFPPEDPLICTKGNSSGLCTFGFNCNSNFRCVPTVNFPGITTKWALFEWKRSINSQMGYWSNLAFINAPSNNPTLTNLNTSTGITTIYSSNVGNVDSSYTLISNSVISTLSLVYNRPGDWVPTDVITIVPYTIRFISTNNLNKVALLIKLTYNNINIFFVLLSDLPISSTLTFLLPTKTLVTSIPSGDRAINIKDFDLDLRNTGRLLYTNNNQETFTSNVLISFVVFPLTLSNFFIILQKGPKTRFIRNTVGSNDTSFYAVQRLDSNIYLSPSGIVIGNSVVNDMSVTTVASTNSDRELLYTKLNTRYIYYRLGENDVILPVDIQENGLTDIGVLDSTIIGSNILPGLFMISTSI